jgi:hypothetical protein
MSLMQEQVIDAALARELHAEACRNHAYVSWVVYCDQPDFPDNIYVARLWVTSGAWPYVLVGDSLSEIYRQLPVGLERVPRARTDPSSVIETWMQP